MSARFTEFILVFILSFLSSFVRKIISNNSNKYKPYYIHFREVVRLVTIKTSDGKIYTNPKDIHIPRTDKTEAFFKLVEQYVPKREDKTA